jgi:hypothetical protein
MAAGVPILWFTRAMRVRGKHGKPKTEDCLKLVTCCRHRAPACSVKGAALQLQAAAIAAPYCDALKLQIFKELQRDNKPRG